jgi:hypothetical protein
VVFAASPTASIPPDGTQEWMGFFKEPDGNMLALMSLVKP